MSGPRLCEVKEELAEAVAALPLSDSRTKSRWSLLECPNRQHCDPSRPCSGMTASNRQAIAKIRDVVFIRGFVREGE